MSLQTISSNLSGQLVPMLLNLRPTKSTDLAVLNRIAGNQPVPKLLPSQLNEPDLLSLALDLRRIEVMMKGGPDAGESMSVGIFMAFEFLMHLTPNGAKAGLTLDEESLIRAIQVIGFAVEREIVTRIVGVSDGSGDEYFLNALRRIDH